MDNNITLGEVLKVIGELNSFIDNYEKNIISLQNTYNISWIEMEKQQKKEEDTIIFEYNQKIDLVKSNSRKLINDARKIKEEVEHMNGYLSQVDKYYLKTQKKLSDLGGARLYKFDDNTNYFSVIRQIKEEFEIVSKKYSQEILPSVLNGINYILSNKRKKEYEQLILLLNTVNCFWDEINNVIPDIELNEIEAIEKQFTIQLSEYKQECTYKKEMYESRYIKALNTLAEKIDYDLDCILSDEKVLGIREIFDEYRNTLVNLDSVHFDKNIPIFIGTIEVPIRQYTSSTILVNFIIEKYNSIFSEDTLKLPVIWSLAAYKTLYIANADSSDVNKKEFVQSIMYSCLATLPATNIKFTIFDCETHGCNIERFFGIKKNMPELFGEKIYSDNVEVIAYLKKLNMYIDDCIQNKLSSASNTIFDEEGINSKKKAEFVILFDFPRGLDEKALSIIKNIDEYGKRCGIFLLIVESGAFVKSINSSDKIELLNKIKSASVQIVQNNKEMQFYGLKFSYFNIVEFEKLEDNLSECKVDLCSKNNNEYFSLYPICGTEKYVKQYKKIEVPFALDEEGNIRTLSFENENFATYLMGASRSGKSTLIHTIIASIIQNYHPDMVELWLADFKQLEFKRYIDHKPPHVKYILLDESEELVFDLIDKLTDVMMERQRTFGNMKNENGESINKITDINYKDLKHPMPVILVILDEFSIMSQAIQRQLSGEYKLKLQNLLAKGGGLGIKFLFASQTYRNGVGGLSQVAKEQIQQRVAMKASSEEITDVLDLSTRLKTEQVKVWIESLPPHYALIKTKMGMDTLPIVDRLWVLYIKQYTELEKYIDMVGELLQPSPEYNSDSAINYVEKNAVIVDGNVFDGFDKEKVLFELNKIYSQSYDFAGDELVLYLGRPRLMSEMKGVIVTPESRQNILLIANSSERACAASVITSVIYSMQCQDKEVEIWSYDRNPILRKYRDTEWKNVKIISQMEDVCCAIANCKDELDARKTKKDRMIILLGFERLCTEFSYLEPRNSKTSHIEKIALEERSISEDIINEIFDFDEEDIFDDITLDEEDYLRVNSRKNFNDSIKDNLLYDASMDLVDIIKNGSRQGIHFMNCINSYSDLALLKVRVEEFTHRIAFRMPKEEVPFLFPSGSAETVSNLPEHVCAYTDNVVRYSLRPYLHKNITWEDWYINSKGKSEKKYE